MPPVEDADSLEGWQPLVDSPAIEAPAIDPPRRRPLGGDERSPINSSALWIPAQAVADQASELSMTSAGIDLGVPLYMQEGNVWLLTGGVHRLEVGGGAWLPDSQIALPDEFWKVSIGTMHFRELDNGWQAGGILSVGSASDEPFAGLREMTATAVAFLNVPSGDDDAWNFSLFYSPTSQLPFPIPGVAYVWRASDRLEMKIGIPFSVQYRPIETLTLSATYMPLTNVRLHARQQLGESWCAFAGYEVTNDTYFLSERIDSDDRLYFFDQRVRVGLERKLLWGFSAEVAAGYVFDRTIFQADGFSGDRRDELDIGAGVMGTAMISWRR